MGMIKQEGKENIKVTGARIRDKGHRMFSLWKTLNKGFNTTVNY